VYSIIPPKRRPRLSVAVPASLVSDVPHLREKTSKIGLVGRALAMFRVDEVIIYPDHPERGQKEEAELIALILSFMETPQYLRKRLFRIRPELRYVGILPPLRTPHHPLKNIMEELKVGEYREGVVVSVDEKGSKVDIGVGIPINVPNVSLPLNCRFTVKIIEVGKNPKAKVVNTEDVEAYWGYKTTISNVPFGRMLKERAFDLVIATSRHGKLLTEVKDDLVAKWRKSQEVLLAFGSPSEGLYYIVRREKLQLDEIADFVINTIPFQATETVRTEEAIFSTLAILNFLII